MIKNKYFLNEKKVLIVDNSSFSQSFLKKSLVKIGFDSNLIYFSSNYNEAINILKNRNFDFVFSEYNIGNYKNCHDLMNFIQKLNLKDVPNFIVLTNECSTNIVLSVFDINPNSYITKPYNLSILEKKIYRVLDENMVSLYIEKKLTEKGVDAALISCENCIISNPSLFTFILKIKSKILLENSRIDEAKLLYKTLMYSKPNNIQLIIEYSKILIKEKKYKEAEFLLIDLIEREPKVMEIYNTLEDLYNLNENNNNKSIILKKSLEINPLSKIRYNKIVSFARSIDDNNLLIFAHDIFLKNNKNFNNNNIKLEFLFLKIKKYIQEKNVLKINKYKNIVYDFKNQNWDKINFENKSILFLIEFQILLYNKNQYIKRDFEKLYFEYKEYINYNKKIKEHIFDYLLKNNITDIISVFNNIENKKILEKY